jgi:hypothetical protein
MRMVQSYHEDNVQGQHSALLRALVFVVVVANDRIVRDVDDAARIVAHADRWETRPGRVRTGIDQRTIENNEHQTKIQTNKLSLKKRRTK